MRRISGSFGVLFLAIGIASCGGGSSTAPTCPGNTFCLLNTTFSPTALSVASGTTVTWEIDQPNTHNVIWDNAAGKTAAGAGDATGDIGTFSAGTHTRRFTTTGTFGFHCTIHPGMAATLTVTP